MTTCQIHVYAENDFKNYEDEIDSEQLTKLAHGKANLIRFLELFELYEQLLDAHVEAKSVFYKLNIESQLCVFRGHPDSDSGLSRTSISVSSGH